MSDRLTPPPLNLEDIKSGSKPEAETPLLSRRDLLGGAGGMVGMTLAARAWAANNPPALQAITSDAGDRLQQAFQIRLNAAELERSQPRTHHIVNGDEEELPGRIACFSKCLPHNRLGQVDLGAYDTLLRAVRSGEPRDFELIPVAGRVKLANPQAALAFHLIGPDPSQPALPPPPRFSSAEQAGEMVELFWQSLTRDIPFEEYESHPRIAQAAEDLSRLSDFRGPKEEGRVTPRTLFRGNSAGDRVGPYISQFLWKDIFFTPIRIEQRIRTAAAGLDFLTGWDEWLRCQNGSVAPANRFDERPRYLRNGRDLGEYVHRDFTYQAPLSACLILLKMGALPDGGNPYKHSRTQSGFATFGSPQLLSLLAIVTQVSLAACWYQKWMVHRRLRPEELGGRVANHLRRREELPLHKDLLDATALQEILRRGTAGLLPVAYPEGSPTHPAYPAGHAVIAGACVTVLKAFFDESYVIPDPVVASSDGLSLRPWRGEPLTVGRELDKLASNIGLGRSLAGVHWRSDSQEGLLLGERVAISVLREMKLTGNELFDGFTLHKLDGERITL